MFNKAFYSARQNTLQLAAGMKALYSSRLCRNLSEHRGFGACSRVLYFIVIIVVISGFAACKNPVTPPTANSAPYKVTASIATQTYNQGSGDQTFQLEIEQVAGLDDPDGDVVSFKSSVLPAWISLDEATGVVTVDTTAAQSSTSVDFWSEDEHGEDTSGTPFTVLVSVNSAPVATFYDYDYLVEGAGTTGANGEYTLLPDEIDSTAAYSNGTHYIFRYLNGPRYWCIDSVTSGQSSSADMLYYKFYSSVSDYLPETKPEDSSADYSKGDGTLSVPEVTGRMPISGYTGEEGYILRGNYIFSDEEGDLETNTTYKWYRSDDSSVTGLEIPNATDQTYETSVADEGQFLRFEVIPADSSGSIGMPLLSDPVYIST